eukprot:3480207-Lingulodinium_polyedra.AAC.1
MGPRHRDACGHPGRFPARRARTHMAAYSAPQPGRGCVRWVGSPARARDRRRDGAAGRAGTARG